MKVIIMRGVSGAGKSTWIRNNYPLATLRSVVSADHYFTDAHGIYRFDPNKLGEAHGACLRLYLEHIRKIDPLIVVDNTNTTVAEIAPYYALAEAYGYEVEIVTLTVEPALAYERNVHKVPLTTIDRQHYNLVNERLPPRWRHRTH